MGAGASANFLVAEAEAFAKIVSETEVLGSALADLPSTIPMPRMAADRAYKKVREIATKAMNNCHNLNDIVRKATEQQRRQASGPHTH